MVPKKVNENEKYSKYFRQHTQLTQLGQRNTPKSMQQKNYKWISVPLPHMRNQKLFMTQFVVFEHELLQLRRREKYDKKKKNRREGNLGHAEGGTPLQAKALLAIF